MKRLLQGLFLRPVCVLGSCQVRPPKRGMSRTRRLVATGCFQGCCMSFQNKWPRKQLGGRQNGYGSFFDQQSTICAGAQRASEHFITTNTLSSHVKCRSVIFIVILIIIFVFIRIALFSFSSPSSSSSSSPSSSSSASSSSSSTPNATRQVATSDGSGVKSKKAPE